MRHRQTKGPETDRSDLTNRVTPRLYPTAAFHRHKTRGASVAARATASASQEGKRDTREQRWNRSRIQTASSPSKWTEGPFLRATTRAPAMKRVRSSTSKFPDA